MSSYTKSTKHPNTGKWEDALWLDDYYGKHNYGVKFKDGLVVDPDKIKLETKSEEREE